MPVPDAVSRFSGFAAEYDAARPTPPADLVALITQWSGTQRPDVVDIGAGTGLSTMIWAGHARQVTAVEPGADMRAVLERKAAAAPAGGTRFTVTAGTAEDTGLADGCADIVTASQAMHWFDVGRALPEIARLLRPGGVFASYDHDWPPCVHWELDAAYAAFYDRVDRLEASRGLLPPHAGKDHLPPMAASGLFRHVREVAVHGRERGDARRMVTIALSSMGGAVALLAAGVTEDELGVSALREVADRRLAQPVTWWWTYRIRLGVK
jgi:SAM-dependent methyltransferase